MGLTGLLPRRRLPILMYHRVGPGGPGDPALWVSEELFRRHLGWIARRGLRTLSLDQAFAAWRDRRQARRGVLLTIDDAFDETLAAAGGLLGQAAMRAAVFVPAGLLGERVRLARPASGSAYTEGRIADRDELGRWLAAGHDVGCHSLSHAALPGLEPEAARRETAEARARLEEALGRPVLDFCYPFTEHDAASRARVAAAGYRAAYAGEPPRDDLFALPRMMVYPGDTEARFGRKLSGYYQWLSGWHGRLRPRARGDR